MIFSPLVPSLLLLLAAFQVGPSDRAILSIEGRSGGFGVSDEWSVSFHSARDNPQSAPYWMVRIRRSYRGPPGQSEQLDQWIDARRCPAVLDAAAGLRSFDAPTGYEPDQVGKAARYAPHGVRFVLTTTGASNGGQVSTATVDETGLVLGELSQQTLLRLRPCIE